MMAGVMADVRLAIDKEKQRAADQWGKFYHSPHEAWGVLMEEYGEAMQEIKLLQQAMDDIPKAITEEGDGLYELVGGIYGRAMMAACELCQVAAVCLKTVDTIREGKA